MHQNINHEQPGGENPQFLLPYRFNEFAAPTASYHASLQRSASDAARSDVSFHSIETVYDRGAMIHAKMLRQRRIPFHSASMPWMPKSDSKLVPSLARRQSLWKENATISKVSDKIWAALQKSDFCGKKYLPLDQLMNIISPPVIRRLLKDAFGDGDALLISRLEQEVLGHHDANEPLPGRRRILAILILQNEVEKFRDFVDAGIHDSHLPLALVRSRYPNPEDPEDSECESEPEWTLFSTQKPEAAARYVEKWSSGAAHGFEVHQNFIHVPFFQIPAREDKVCKFYELDHEAALPFETYEIGKAVGGHGSVLKVKIHNAHYEACDDNGCRTQVGLHYMSKSHWRALKFIWLTCGD
jgi:hypothetical protein